MKRSSKTSGSGSLICPFCEVGELERKGSVSARCTSCGKVLGWSILEDLRQLIALPESLGTHACECGHPEMRRLPDGVFHCPACGSEILPLVFGTARNEDCGEARFFVGSSRATYTRRSR